MKASLIALAFYFSCLAAWITALIVDGTAKAWGWLIADILVSPFGVVRGFCIWLGLAG